MYSALDRKPKAVEALRLKRVRNIQTNPRVALVIDDYSEDWGKLGYVLVQGLASILTTGAERERAEALLREKYPQYDDLLDEGCAFLRIVPDSVVTWAPSRGAPC